MTPLRETVLKLLPQKKGIFLRCDRGSALYVTNSPAFTDAQIDWESAGFVCRTEGKLLFLSPEEAWIDRAEQWLRARTEPHGLSEALRNACFGEVMDEDRALFIEGMKALEMKGDVRAYEKKIRQRAAVCLREKQGGGTLAVCGLMIDFLNEGGKEDEA